MINEEAIKLIDDRMCFGRGKWSEHHRPERDVYWQAGEMAIKALEAEPHWIPVTERLPEEEGEYLVTSVYQYYRDGRKTYKTTVDRWSRNGAGKEWVATSNDAHIAWMPLPEPMRMEKQ